MNREKISKEQVRSDLKNIRYYYVYHREIEKARQDCYLNFVNKVKLYNQMIAFASLPLYKVYHELYIVGSTQEVVSEKLNFSTEYISKFNARLIDFFYSMMSLPDFVF